MNIELPSLAKADTLTENEPWSGFDPFFFFEMSQFQDRPVFVFEADPFSTRFLTRHPTLCAETEEIFLQWARVDLMGSIPHSRYFEVNDNRNAAMHSPFPRWRNHCLGHRRNPQIPRGNFPALLLLSGMALFFVVPPVTAASSGGGGQVLAWGDDSLGQTDVPSGLTNAVGVAGSGLHDLAVRADGTVMAWGYGLFGQTNVPPGLTNAIAVSAGAYFSVALKLDGTVIAWGYGLDGATNVPVGLSNVVAISAAHHSTLALLKNGTVVKWPPNWGAPPPADLTNVVAIAAGGNSDVDHYVALLRDGTMRAWGDDYFGQGDFPPGLTGVQAIAAGDQSTFAILNDRTVAEWGQGNPVPSSGLSNVVAIANEVALKSDGTLVTWVADSSAASFTNVIAIGSGVAIIGEGPPKTGALLTNGRLDSGGFTVSIPTASGRVYELEYKNSLSDPDWTALPLVAGIGNILSLTDPNAPLVSQRFYRVRSW